MPISGKIQINKLVSQIKAQTQSISFSTVFAKIQSQHVFKYSLDPICKICQMEALNELAQNCYRLVLLRMLQENKQNKWWGSRQVVQSSLRQTSTNIKQKYCQLLEGIKQRKSQTMEFVLFLIFFSLQTVFDLLLDNQTLCTYFEEQFEKEKHAIQRNACIWINLQITGVCIRQSVYRHLLKKYYDRLKTNRKTHNKSKTVQNLTNRCNFQILQNLPQQKSQFKENKQENIKKIFQLNNELKLIFSKGNNTSKTRNKSKKKSCEEVENGSNLSFSQQHTHNKIFGQAFLRNSNAFNEKRKEIYDKKGLRQTQYSNLEKIKKKCENKNIMRQSKDKKMMGLNLVSATYKFLMGRDLKKNNLNVPKKVTIQDWENKLRKMQNQGQIQRVSLACSTKRLRKTISADFDEQRMIIDHLKQNNNDTINTFRSIKILECEKRRKPRQGFCQFIDNREPKQIGIVKSIVNFTNTRDQPKNPKLSSKGFKQQYEIFNKKMIDHVENFFEDDNFTYRLQKVITGTNKY